MNNDDDIICIGWAIINTHYELGRTGQWGHRMPKIYPSERKAQAALNRSRYVKTEDYVVKPVFVEGYPDDTWVGM